MEVHSDSSEFIHIIERQKQTLQKARSRQGQRPSDRKPKEHMYIEFMMVLRNTTTADRGDQSNLIHSSFIPPAYLPCTTPLAQLTPMSIRQLMLETHHRGKYLLLRAIAPPNRMTAIIVLAEDESEDAVVLQLYQQEEENIRQATDVVNVGTTLLVKEPYFKIMASGDYGLRVDHLSDIVYVDRGDPILPKRWNPPMSEAEQSAEISKSKGDSAVGAGNYWKAIEEYSRAMSRKTTSERIKIIKRNRSLAYLKTNHYDSALSDTGFPDFGPTPAEKALFRAAEALYFLQRFDECNRVLKTLCTEFPNNKQAKAIFDRVQSRRTEVSSGNYNFGLLQKEAKKLQPPQLDHATYMGPIEIKESAGKGRGIFVTKPVKAGELLLCEKAFAQAYVPETGVGNSRLTLLVNIEAGRSFMGGQADLIKIIVQKIYRNPSLAATFTALHHGDYKTASTTSVDGQPVVDTFLVEKIMGFNVFGCPLSSLETHKSTAANDSKTQAAYHSCGIWTQASYINHSCMQNARRSFIGDMMIVRATRDLQPGEEITFWYHMPSGEPLKAQEKLKNWQFVCDCAICQDDATTEATVHAERKKLLKELQQVFQPSPQQNLKLGKAKRLLKALNDTYQRSMDEVPRLLVWDPQALLTRIYLVQGKIEKALGSFQQTLSLLGFSVAGADCTPEPFRIVRWGLFVDHLIEAFLQAREAFMAIGSWGDSETARVYAKVAFKIVVGEDGAFESMYG
ncbi:hypothetical protein C7974DRAFT_386403, partial [Boeremia exigua]|uniref:uncharacterized protein n=1 Tax=Boeremia exigua TaxID=749465 RepID=UPI001E8E5AD6